MVFVNVGMDVGVFCCNGQSPTPVVGPPKDTMTEKTACIAPAQSISSTEEIRPAEESETPAMEKMTESQRAPSTSTSTQDVNMKCILKETRVEDDLKDSRFPLKILLSKRRRKVKQLKHEQFDFEIYAKTKKMAGFLTNRPVRWAICFEKYIDQIKSRCCRWEYKLDDRKYTEAHLLLYFQPTEKVEITIQFQSGVVLVNGDNFRKWIEDEFPKVVEIFEDTLGPEEKEIESPLEEINHDMKMVWSKIEYLDNAIAVEDGVIEKMIQRCQSMEIKLHEHSQKLPNVITNDMLLRIEERIDRRVTEFMETTVEACCKRVQELKTGFMADLNILKSTVGNITAKVKEIEMKQPESKPKEEAGTDILKLAEAKSREIVEKEINEIDIDALVEMKVSEKTQWQTTRIENLERERVEKEINEVDVESLVETKLTEKTKQQTTRIEKLEQDVQSLAPAPAPAPKRLNRANMEQRTTTANNHDAQEASIANENLELLICFDSNWQYMDRRKLWKEKGSNLKRCGTLFDVSRTINNSNIQVLKHLLLHVGTNDLDEKDYEQVFDELKQLIDDIRTRFPGVKLIVSELLPRNDSKDSEVLLFNTALKNYAESHDDITLALHHNMRGQDMFYDAKHLKETKVPKFAKNLIRALLSSYNIRDKSELYPTKNNFAPPVARQRFGQIDRYRNSMRASPPNRNLQSKMMNIAGYGPSPQHTGWNPTTTPDDQPNQHPDTLVRDVLLKLGRYIGSCV